MFKPQGGYQFPVADIFMAAPKPVGEALKPPGVLRRVGVPKRKAKEVMSLGSRGGHGTAAQLHLAGEMTNSAPTTAQQTH